MRKPMLYREKAREEATSIDLIDCDDLCHLLKDSGIGASVEMVEEVEIDADFFASV